MNESEPKQKKIFTIHDLAAQLEPENAEKRAEIVTSYQRLLTYRDSQWVNAIRGPAYVSSTTDPEQIMDAYRRYFLPTMAIAQRSLTHAYRALSMSPSPTDKMVGTQCYKIADQLEKLGHGLEYKIEDESKTEEFLKHLFPGLDDAAKAVSKHAKV